MADETEMRVVPPTAPPSACLSVSFVVGLFNQLRVFFPGTAVVFNDGPDEPTIENRDKLWIKTDSTTSIVVGIYAWSPTFGAWLKGHWNNNIPPIDQRIMFVGDASEIDLFDGGESGTVSASTGPFWELDTDWSDVIPIGVGTTIPVVGTNDTAFATGTDTPNLRSAYFLKPTGRLYDRA